MVKLNFLLNMSSVAFFLIILVISLQYLLSKISKRSCCEKSFFECFAVIRECVDFAVNMIKGEAIKNTLKFCTFV